MKEGAVMADTIYLVAKGSEERYYISKGKTAEELLKIAAESENPFTALCEEGKRLTLADHTTEEQSERCGVSVDFHLDENTADIYEINEGKGGISEENRTDSSVSHQEVNIAEYRELDITAEDIQQSAHDRNVTEYYLVYSNEIQSDKEYKLLETAVSRSLADGKPSDFINSDFFQDLYVRTEGDDIKLMMTMASYDENVDMSVYEKLAIPDFQEGVIEIPLLQQETDSIRQAVQTYEQTHGKSQANEITERN